MSPKNRFVAFTLLLALLLPAPLSAARAAGGEIAGTVTDPKGAGVVGATGAVYGESGGQPPRTARTDRPGP